MSTEAFLYDAIRTPRGKGKPTGALHEVEADPADHRPAATNCGPGTPTSIRERRSTTSSSVWSRPIGDQGMDIARTAVLAAGYPETTGGVQLNRFCASGLEAVNQAAQRIRSGWEDFILAGGVESMSRVPMASDGGAWAMDPETALADQLHPAGHQRRPDRDDRRLLPDRRRHVRRRVPRARRQGLGQRVLRPLGRPGRRPQRPADPGPRPARPPRYDGRDAGRPACVVRGDR